MQTLTPSAIVFKTHLQPSCPKPLRFYHVSSLSPSIPDSRRKNPLQSSRNPCTVFPRFSSQWTRHKNLGDQWLGNFQTSSSNAGCTESKFPDGRSCNGTSKLMQFQDDFVVLGKSPVEITSTSEDCMPTSSFKHALPISDSFFHGSLKFALLLGLFTFQGSETAVAALEIASGLQSVPFLGDLGDISTGFTSAFLLIFFSELGDKTFFIAALLAARSSGAIVFIGTYGALVAMTIISVVLGRTFHYVDGILPFRFGETDLPIDDIAAVCLLAYFGITTLLDTASDDGLKADEEQKEAEIAVSRFSGNGAGMVAAANTIISTFALVFIAEWGDKSFFSTHLPQLPHP
ncbi:PREDICTED: GDT1-like protein 1, chloroplastic isoform X2 [Nelumbo nucifera]|uniref:GDT1 family protein n=1 Tax=Nelumbo nucifera TaxID=4432 RepID=A0A1U8AGC5_NELNU|nr:PREDICTED: GDT1-like protein 1, chloroplastic isoform X2 [Nelumbo nucifera]